VRERLGPTRSARIYDRGVRGKVVTGTDSLARSEQAIRSRFPDVGKLQPTTEAAIGTLRESASACNPKNMRS
jgi:hypothetical protein